METIDDEKKDKILFSRLLDDNDEVAGDALAKIMEKHQEKITYYLWKKFRYLKRYYGDAFDLAIDVFYRLWKHRKKWKLQSLKSLIYGIAQKVYQEFYRKNGKNFQNIESIETVPQANTLKSLEGTDIEIAEEVTDIAKKIKEFKEEDQEIFRLYLEKLKFKEISDIMSMNETTVKKRCQRMIKKLKEFFTQKENNYGR